jgi:8-oxo-dGTP pyrophosphatase MutT (NUDIX family)
MARRGTAIIETEQGILLAAMPRDSFLLPGGGANSSESRLQATVRELYEETGLRAFNTMYLFTFRSRKNDHRVFWVQAIGVPRPTQEIERIGYYQNGVITGIFDKKGTHFSNANFDKASESTRAIIKLFEEYKAKHPAFFQQAEAHQHIVEQHYAQRIYTPEDQHL